MFAGSGGKGVICFLRIAFVYSIKDKGFVKITRFLIEQFEKGGHSVKEIEVENMSSPLSFRPFDLIFIGSQVESIFGGRISREITHFLSGASGLEGKKTVAYVRPSLFSTDKALRRLMAQMESRGAFVVDFDSVKNERDAQGILSRHLEK